MQQSEIKVGGCYKAKIAGRVVVVQVESIRRIPTKRAPIAGTTRERVYPGRTVYDVVNLYTKRLTTFRSAMRFREPCNEPPARHLPNPPVAAPPHTPGPGFTTFEQTNLSELGFAPQLNGNPSTAANCARVCWGRSVGTRHTLRVVPPLPGQTRVGVAAHGLHYNGDTIFYPDFADAVRVLGSLIVAMTQGDRHGV